MVLLEKGEACFLSASANIYYTVWGGQWYKHPLEGGTLDFQPVCDKKFSWIQSLKDQSSGKVHFSLMLHNAIIFLMGKSADQTAINEKGKRIATMLLDSLTRLVSSKSRRKTRTAIAKKTISENETTLDKKLSRFSTASWWC